MPREVPMPRVAAFQVRTASIFNSMKSRFRERRNYKGTLLRPAMPLTFTLTEFQAWFLEKLGDRADGCCKCPYCPRQLTAENARFDHVIPIARGGSVGLENLEPVCETDNREKGELTGEEFKTIIFHLDELLRHGLLGPAGYSDVRKRLRGQVAIFAKKGKKPAYSGRSASTSSMFDPAEEAF